jgi:RNA polymerase sigma-70 factor (ECF subfamily)
LTEGDVATAYERYGHLVLGRCQRILRDAAAAEDALQEAFTRLWTYGDSFAGAESKVAWLYRVADRCCFDALDRRARRGEESLETVPARHLQQPPTGARAVDDREVVIRFLSRFDRKVRQVAVHHYLDEMTQEEIARATGWSRQTIHKKLRFLEERAQALRGPLLGEGAGR